MAEPMELRVGVTTAEQSVAQFGSPENDSIMVDGRRLMSYVGAQVMAAPERFSPYMGYTPRSADPRAVMVVLMFARNGKLQTYSVQHEATGGNSLEGKVRAEEFLTPDAVYVRPSVASSPLLGK